MKRYIPLMLDTRAAWVDLEASFPLDVISTWTVMVVAWEADPKRPNPFWSTVQYKSLHEVKQHLADIAAEDVELIHVRGDMHETEMLSMGLQLEEQQRHLVYACKQAAYMEGLAARFEAAWKDVPGYLRDACVAYMAIHPDDDDDDEDRGIGGGTDNIGLTEDSGWLTD
ncbi:hypothetical protein B0H14DRAFT_2642815 [Mycena olivaceomarginata]|nr:hypothetical protein B0H14DRAFT_2642815 [Mycena olivaceomarginata]